MEAIVLDYFNKSVLPDILVQHLTLDNISHQHVAQLPTAHLFPVDKYTFPLSRPSQDPAL